MRVLACLGTALGLSVVAQACSEPLWVPSLDDLGKAAYLETAEQRENLLWMLEQGVNPDTPMRNGYTMLMTAASNVNTTAMELLLYAGADVNVRTQHEQYTPLHLLLNSGRNRSEECQRLTREYTISYHREGMAQRVRDAVDMLLAAGADVNAVSREGYTPLSFAVHGGAALVEYLLQRGATLPAEGSLAHDALLEKVVRCRGGCLAVLLRAGLNPNTRLADDSTLLMNAVANRDIEHVKLLLAAGAEVNVTTKSGRTVLGSALQGHLRENETEARLEMLRVLLAAGVDPLQSQRGSNEIHRIVQYKKADMLGLLLSACPQGLEIPNQQGATPLMLAAQYGDEATLRLLLESGANVHARDNDGRSVLAYAARCVIPDEYHLNRLQLLADYGASVRQDGPAAFVVACQSGTEKSVRWLLKTGMSAKTSMEGYSGNTPLHWATCNHHAGVVTALIEAGAPVNAQNSVGNTPLHFAVQYSHPLVWHVVSVLLREGANPHQPNNLGKTPMDYASPAIREKLRHLLHISPPHSLNSDS